MKPEYRVILERMRSSAGVVRRAVEAAPLGRFGQAPRGRSCGRRKHKGPHRCMQRGVLLMARP